MAYHTACSPRTYPAGQNTNFTVPLGDRVTEWVLYGALPPRIDFEESVHPDFR